MALIGMTSMALAAGLQAPDFKLERLEKGVRATAPAKHHFNLQAPKELRSGASKHKARKDSTQHELWFDSPGNGEITVKAYLCDDANTFCEEHVVKLAGEAGAPAASAPAPEAHASLGPAPVDPMGFIVNDSAAALARAKKEGKPLLVDFFGIWCPPCNQLDEHVFSTPEFAREAKRFVLLKLDADSDASWDFKSRFKVGGYPTLVFATSAGDEISRVVGFRPKEELIREMKGAWELRAEPVTVLEARAKAGDRAASLRLARAKIQRREYDVASALLDKGDLRETEEGYFARIGAIQQLESRDKDAFATRVGELQSLYEKGISRFPDLPEAVEWGFSLADIHEKAKREDAKKAALKDAAARAERIAGKPALLKGRDYRPVDLWSMAADAREQIEDKDGAKRNWTEAAQGYRKLLRSNDERGYNLELAYALWKSGDATGAEEIYQRLEKRFPHEFTFWYAHARQKVREKNHAAAKPLAENALANSYGDNRLRSAQLLAEVLMTLGQKDEARKVVETESAKVKLPDDPSIRTHAYVKALKAVLEKK